MEFLGQMNGVLLTGAEPGKPCTLLGLPYLHPCRRGGQPGAHLTRGARVLWSPSYFAVSVGDVWESTVRGYIERQGDAVLAS